MLAGCGRGDTHPAVVARVDARATASVERMRLQLVATSEQLDLLRADRDRWKAEAERARATPPRASRNERRTPLPVSSAPRNASPPNIPGGLLRRIGGCESSGRPDGPLLWTATNRRGSSASGAYQILDSTWRNWASVYGADVGAGRFGRAMHAPPDVQSHVAGRALAAQGPSPWKASRGCWR